MNASSGEARRAETGKTRAYRPGKLIFSGEWLNYRENVPNVEAAIARFPGGRLLDVGCGARPFECRPNDIEWVGFDIEGNEHADYHGVATALPFPDQSFGCVLATQVLEHVEDPLLAMREFARVLQPGGLLILAVPQYWELHEIPYDFFRFTEYGLKKLCDLTGFDVVELRREATGFKLAGIAINSAINQFAGRPTSLFWKAVKAPFYLLVNLACLAFDAVFKNERDVQGYTLSARKREQALTV